MTTTLIRVGQAGDALLVEARLVRRQHVDLAVPVHEPRRDRHVLALVFDPDPRHVGLLQAVLELLGETVGRGLLDHLELGLPEDLAVQEEGGDVHAELIEDGVLDQVIEAGQIHHADHPADAGPDPMGDPPRRGEELHLLRHVAGGGLVVPDHRERQPAGRQLEEEHHVLDAGIDHGVQQVETVHHVVAKVLARLGHRLPDVGATGEVDHSLRLIFTEGLLDRRLVTEIPLHKRPPADRPTVPCLEVVKNHRFDAGGSEAFGSGAADVACSADDQDTHNTAVLNLLRGAQRPVPDVAEAHRVTVVLQAQRPDRPGAPPTARLCGADVGPISSWWLWTSTPLKSMVKEGGVTRRSPSKRGAVQMMS